MPSLLVKGIQACTFLCTGPPPALHVAQWPRGVFSTFTYRYLACTSPQRFGDEVSLRSPAFRSTDQLQRTTNPAAGHHQLSSQAGNPSTRPDRPAVCPQGCPKLSVIPDHSSPHRRPAQLLRTRAVLASPPTRLFSDRSWFSLIAAAGVAQLLLP